MAVIDTFTTDTGTLVIGTSSRTDGDMRRENATRHQAVANRSRFIAGCGLAHRPVTYVPASHSPNVAVVSRAPGHIFHDIHVRVPRVHADFTYYLDGFDGVLSRERERAVGLVTGDCIPLTLWSNTTPFHGVIHIGLLGALNRTAVNAVEVAVAIGHPTADLECYLGAAVGQSQYDLSRSGLWTAIEADAYSNAPEVEHYQVQDGRSLKMDLVGMVRDQLAAASIPAARIHALADGAAGRDARFFSHSADTSSGLLPTRRLMTVVGYL